NVTGVQTCALPISRFWREFTEYKSIFRSQEVYSYERGRNLFTYLCCHFNLFFGDTFTIKWFIVIFPCVNPPAIRCPPTVFQLRISVDFKYKAYLPIEAVEFYIAAGCFILFVF